MRQLLYLAPHRFSTGDKQSVKGDEDMSRVPNAKMAISLNYPHVLPPLFVGLIVYPVCVGNVSQ
jgi:hypothetical protein